MLNLVFGALPFLAAVLLTQMREDSNQAHLWLSIVRLESNKCFTCMTEGLMMTFADASRIRKCCCATDTVQ